MAGYSPNLNEKLETWQVNCFSKWLEFGGCFFMREYQNLTYRNDYAACYIAESSLWELYILSSWRHWFLHFQGKFLSRHLDFAFCRSKNFIFFNIFNFIKKTHYNNIVNKGSRIRWDNYCLETCWLKIF